jgi:hypothetical protein
LIALGVSRVVLKKWANEYAIAVFLRAVFSMTRIAAAVIAGDTPDVQGEKLSHQAPMVKIGVVVAQGGLYKLHTQTKTLFRRITELHLPEWAQNHPAFRLI